MFEMVTGELLRAVETKAVETALSHLFWGETLESPVGRDRRFG